jgi:hypothetical protein
VAGLGLGGLASSAVIWYGNNPGSYSVNAKPEMWFACLIIGAGLGMAIAATIREEPKLERD